MAARDDADFVDDDAAVEEEPSPSGTELPDYEQRQEQGAAFAADRAEDVEGPVEAPDGWDPGGREEDVQTPAQEARPVMGLADEHGDEVREHGTAVAPPGPAAQSPNQPPSAPPERAVAAALAGGLRPIVAPIEASERPWRHRAKGDGPSLRPHPAPSPRDPRPPRPPRAPRLPRGAAADGGGLDGLVLWRYVTLAIVAVVCVGLIAAAMVKSRNDATAAEKAAAAYTPPPVAAASVASPSPSGSPGAALPVISVVGDELTAGSNADSGTKSEWPALLAAAMPARVETFAAPGAGYVTKGTGGATLVSEAAHVDPASNVVVLFGGGNDTSNAPLSVAAAATTAISAAQRAAPSAKILIVGPTSSVTTPSSALLAIRDTLQATARIANAGWQDPISAAWLSSSSSLTSGSGIPNDQGEKALESKLQSALNGMIQ